MESFSGETEDSTEDVPGRKKSKLKVLKSRLFGRSKRGGGEGGDTKLSQSASDITAGKGLGSNEDLLCSQGMMGSRALSHDSIFLADQALTDSEPARVLSQENVHSKIKALQIKLQQQKMHFGPPPLVVPVRRPEDVGSRSEDDGLPHSPTEISGASSKTTSQPSSRPLSPVPKPAATKSSLPLPLSIPSNSSSSVVEPPLDFSSPAQFTPCLDTSAARHRMAIKPRNQRASSKRTLAANDSKSDLHTLNNINHPVREEERQLSSQEEATLETEQGEAVVPIISQHLSSISPEVEPITSSSPAVSQQDQALGSVPSVPSQVLRVKPADITPSEQPHSSILSELKDNRERDVDVQDERNTLNKAGIAEVSTNVPSSSVHQQVQGEPEQFLTRGIRRPTKGSGSFHFSVTTAKNRDLERPRSGSFVGVLGHTEARHKTGSEDKPFSSMREKEELRGVPFVVGRLRQEEAPHKSLAAWDKRDSVKKVESVTPHKTTDTGAADVVEELGSSQEVVEEAAEAKEVDEDEGKMAFGVKLRSTSLLTRVRSDYSSNHNSKPPECEEQCDKLIKPEIRDLQLADPTPSGFSPPVKHNPPLTGSPPIMATEVQTSNLKEAESAASQEPQPAPQTASSEVSWMSLAMEKTRGLQQLFTSRFPRDFTGMQAAARPQAQETPTGLQTQTVKIQPSTTPVEAANPPPADAVKAEAVQSRSQTQTVKPALTAVQQKTNTSREPQTLKQVSEPQSASQSPAVQTIPWTTQSPLHSSAQIEISSQSAQGGATQSLAQFYLSSGQQQQQQQQQQPPPWSNRVLQPTNQLKSTTSVSTTSSASAPPPSISAPGRVEREATVQEKDGAAMSGKRAVWSGSVSERAAFLERRAEWSTPPGTKGVEWKKTQTEVQTSGESPALVKPTPLSKDIKPEGRQGVKLAESSPTRVPERPREDKWLRKNVACSSPSSSPTMQSALQSMTDSGQPSWMELAKRKSMAWSDKSMD